MYEVSLRDTSALYLKLDFGGSAYTNVAVNNESEGIKVQTL